jgi:hypothetical protein
VRASGVIQIRLQAAPQSLRQDALIMVLASDHWHIDFAIGQDHSRLRVWLRRPGTDTEGVPGFAVAGVFHPQRWTTVEVTLLHGGLRVDVDSRTRLTGHLPAASPRMWGPGQVALGDEVHGGDPWHGQIRRAQVRTPGYAVDYVRPGALSIPQSYLYNPDHIRPFPPTTTKQWLAAFLNLLSFIPLGFLIVLSRRPPVRPAPATLLAAAAAVLLGAGKFLFHARHASAVNIVMQVAGGFLGAFLASRLTHAKHGTARLSLRRHQAGQQDAGRISWAAHTKLSECWPVQPKLVAAGVPVAEAETPMAARLPDWLVSFHTSTLAVVGSGVTVSVASPLPMTA